MHARVEFPLEVRGQSGQFHRRFGFLKIPAGVEHFHHLRKIILVIRAQINQAARQGNDAAGQGWEMFLGDQPVFTVLFLRPGVRKINVQPDCCMGRQKVLQKIGRLDAGAAQIDEPVAAAFAVQFRNAAEQAFNPDEISSGLASRIFDEERKRPRNRVQSRAVAILEKDPPRPGA